MRTRTNTLSRVVANRPSGVARQALRSTVHGASHAGLTHAVFAFARIYCEIAVHVSV